MQEVWESQFSYGGAGWHWRGSSWLYETLKFYDKLQDVQR
jgi:hypothetical protein